jgi:hypothetical protein
MPHFCTLIAAFDVLFHLSDTVLRRGRAMDYIQHGGCDWNVLALKPAIVYWMWRNDLPGNDVCFQCVIANTHVFYVPTKSSQPLTNFSCLPVISILFCLLNIYFLDKYKNSRVKRQHYSFHSVLAWMEYNWTRIHFGTGTADAPYDEDFISDLSRKGYQYMKWELRSSALLRSE